MDLKTYLAEPGAKQALAEKLGTDPNYLWQIANGWNDRQASPKFAIRIEEATDGKVTRADLRPDIFGKPSKKAA